MAPKVKDRCSTCRFYRAPDAKAAPGFVPKGKCRRFPEELSKEPADWCGEYRR